MSIVAHAEALKSKHVQLEGEIADELKRPHPNDIQLKTLKQKKYQIKQELASIDA
ncbi:DUF465 domain-containing protein [Alphaproteobacteria bacterium]|jgi:uncharacterized protein|nr:DUF465 domain-containing protein [Alphaproteobacteria bacterium]